jgi:hypothetical protein
MAIGRLSVGVGQKGKASPHALYIAREGKYAKNEKIEKLEGAGYGNMPEWAAADPNFFWKMSDDKERKNGTSYREHVISLPRELTADQRHELIKDWIAQEIGDRHAYQYAIHNPLGADGGEQPHAHIMFSERLIDSIERDPDSYFKRHNSKKPELGGAKKANTPKMSADRKLELKEQRDRWEKLCNQHLELAGSDARISMKSLADQGIERDPIDLSMQQIKTAKIKEIYTNLLSAEADYKSAKIDSLSINVANELSSIKINEKYNEQADQAIARTKQRVSETARDTKRAAEATQQILHRVNATKQLSAVADQAINRTQRCFDSSKQLSAVADQAINRTQRCFDSSKQLSAVTDQAITSSKQLSAVTDQTIARRLAQRKTQQQQVFERTPFDLVNIRMRSKVVNKSYNKVDRNLSGDVPIGSVIRDIIEAAKAGHSATLQEGNNDHLAGNDTAQRIKAFMLKKITSYDAVYDYCNLSVKDFTDKHNLKCDIDDLQRLNDIHPPAPVSEPVKEVKANTVLNLEQNQRAGNSYDNSPYF